MIYGEQLERISVIYKLQGFMIQQGKRNRKRGKGNEREEKRKKRRKENRVRETRRGNEKRKRKYRIEKRTKREELGILLSIAAHCVYAVIC